MRVSEIFAIGGGSGYDGKEYDYSSYHAYGNPEGRFRYSYDFYANYPCGGYSYNGSCFNGGFRNASFSQGRGLIGVRG